MFIWLAKIHRGQTMEQSSQRTEDEYEFAIMLYRKASIQVAKFKVNLVEPFIFDQSRAIFRSTFNRKILMVYTVRANWRTNATCSSILSALHTRDCTC
jgi:hypothetical protein